MTLNNPLHGDFRIAGYFLFSLERVLPMEKDSVAVSAYMY